MHFTRRQVMGTAGAAMLVASLPARAAQPAPAFAAAEARIRAFAEAVLAENGFPGMALALVAPGGWSSAFAVGLSDLDSRTPASPDQLFQIGSITKSLTGMAVFALVARGRLALDARVQALLPDVPLPAEPITVLNLLEHSSGLPNSLEQTPFPQVPGGRLWTGFAPGSRYDYSNLGYTLLGLIVERAAGMLWPRALETLVLRPIGMDKAKAVIRMADRASYANGHVRLREDVPWFPKAALAEARWMDVHTAAGSVAATAHDMAAYLRAAIALGRGRGGPLFSDALAEIYRRPTIDAPSNGPGARYGNGMVTLPVAGRPALRHTGGMIAFSSAFTADPAAEAGCYASVNVGGAAGYRPVEVTEYAIAALRAAASGAPLPPVPQPGRAPPFPAPARITGRWIGPDGRELIVAERGGALWVSSRGLERPLAADSETEFETDHPELAPYSLVLEPGDTPFLRLGPDLYGRDAAPAQRPASARLAPLAGTYYAPGAWSQRINVFAVGDRLFLGSYVVAEAADGSWRFASPNLVSERIWFENRGADGRPHNLNLSGTRYARLPG